jgi:hypothetical protein
MPTVPLNVRDVRSVGMSLAVSKRNVGAAAAPDVGPAKNVLFVCVVVAEMKAVDACVAAVPSPRLVRAVATLARSERFDPFWSDAAWTVAAAPAASNAVVLAVAALPRARLVRAVAALARSLRFEDFCNEALWAAAAAPAESKAEERLLVRS